MALNSDGTPRAEVSIGDVFHRLTVVAAAPQHKGQPMFRCVCVCGKEKITSKGRLISGRTKSCGCLSRELTILRNQKSALPKGEASFNDLYHTYKKSARLRKRCFELTVEDFRCLVTNPCVYCGIAPQQTHLPKACNGGFLHNGIDRVDNDKGYVLDNVVTCCKNCNFAKHGQTVAEFVEYINRAYHHLHAPKETQWHWTN